MIVRWFDNHDKGDFDGALDQVVRPMTGMQWPCSLCDWVCCAGSQPESLKCSH